MVKRVGCPPSHCDEHSWSEIVFLGGCAVHAILHAGSILALVLCCSTRGGSSSCRAGWCRTCLVLREGCLAPIPPFVFFFFCFGCLVWLIFSKETPTVISLPDYNFRTRHAHLLHFLPVFHFQPVLPRCNRCSLLSADYAPSLQSRPTCCVLSKTRGQRSNASLL